MNTKSTAKLGLGLGVVAVAVCGFAAPAVADPADDAFGTLVGVGSDTTQDVMNGIADAIGDDIIASYDATGSSNIEIADGLTIGRPNGSGSGRDVLRVAIGQSPSFSASTFAGNPATWDSNVAGAIGFARSSSGVSGTPDPAGTIAYVPFAVDAVGYATAEETAIPALVKGSAADAPDAEGVLATNSLFALYTGKVDALVTDADDEFLYFVDSDVYETEAGETEHPVSTYIPQPGSGTRSYWIGRFSITEDQISQGVYPNLQATYGGGLSVQEHDGSAVEDDPYALMPFSVGQWIAQGNGIEGVNDRRNGSVIGVLGTVDPVNGTEGSYTLNPSFNNTVGYTRSVYNLVPSAAADDPESLVNEVFVGQDSLVCEQSDVIEAYGFGLLTATSGASACGDTSVRAYPAVGTTVEVTSPSGTTPLGAKANVNITVSATHDAGGVVEFYEEGAEEPAATINMPFGTATKAGKLDTSMLSTGTTELEAVFIPALSGNSASVAEAPVVVKVGKAEATIKASAPKVKVNKTASVKVSVDAGDVSVQGDKVTIKDGKKTLGSGKLGGQGGVTIKIGKFKKADSYKLTVKYEGSDEVKADDTKVTLKVTK